MCSNGAVLISDFDQFITRGCNIQQPTILDLNQFQNNIFLILLLAVGGQLIKDTTNFL